MTAAAMAGVLAACATTTNTDGTLTEPTPVFTGEVPAFEGPYAADFAYFYVHTTSDFARYVIRDGQITDAEYAEMTNRFSSCLADQGITFKGFQPDGSYSTSLAPNPDDTHNIVSECEQSTGADVIGALQGESVRNPGNLDTATIMAACLVRKGVVPEDYSAKEFSQDSTGRFSDFGSLPSDLQDALISCSSDPLGTTN